MRHSIHRQASARAARLAPYQPLLDRIDAFLERANPEIEREKIEAAILMLFGPRPDSDEFDFSPGSQGPPSETAGAA
jgi:hypothetical protein